MKKFNRAALSGRDFHEAWEFFRTLEAEQNNTKRYALMTAAIIAYARPFSVNERDPHALAEKTIHIDLNRVLSPEQMALHHTKNERCL